MQPHPGLLAQRGDALRPHQPRGFTQLDVETVDGREQQEVPRVVFVATGFVGHKRNRAAPADFGQVDEHAPRYWLFAVLDL